MVLFLAEVVFKSIKEEESNLSLFNFLYTSIEWLDGPQAAGNDFHLVFLIQLSRYLGFAPTMNYSSEKNIFNLQEGKFQTFFPDHPNFIRAPLSGFFASLINTEFSQTLNISADERRSLISFILEYYSLHLENFGTINSHKVLEQVWTI